MASDELKALYAEARADNVFFVEYDGMPAAAGDLRDLVELATTADPPQAPADLLEALMQDFLGAIVDLCVPGSAKGDDRVANCRGAWEVFKEYRDKGHFPRVASERLGLPVTGTKRLGTF